MKHDGKCCECVSFKAVTWNVFYGTDTKTLAPILDKLLADDVSILLMQEAGGDDIKRMLRERELHTYLARPQYVVAWNPQRWAAKSKQTIEGREPYFTTEGQRRTSDMALVELHDKLTDRVVHALSYHTPAHVQTAGAQQSVPRRLASVRESAAQWRDLASTRDVCLFGGDDNIDERGAFGPWDFMRRAATGLTQITAPEATHGKTRMIDDFRIKGLRAREGYVSPGGGDHKLHVRRFTYR